MATQKTVTHTLIEPVEFEGKEHTEITLRRLKAKDLKDFRNDNDDMGQTLKIIGRLSGWPPEGVEELDAADLAAIGDIIEGFTGRRR